MKYVAVSFALSISCYMDVSCKDERVFAPLLCDDNGVDAACCEP